MTGLAILEILLARAGRRSDGAWNADEAIERAFELVVGIGGTAFEAHPSGRVSDVASAA
jgi:hypothetical protein